MDTAATGATTANTAADTSPKTTRPPPTQTPGVTLPLLLVAAGTTALLVNLGVLQGISWNQLLRLWPVLLILGGIDLLLRPRSFLLAVVVQGAIVAATFAYLLTVAVTSPQDLSYAVDVPRASASELVLSLSYGAGELTFAGGSTSLVSVRSANEDVRSTVDQQGTRATVEVSSDPNVYWGGISSARNWHVQVPSDVRTDLTLSLGAGDFDVDLSKVQIARASISVGASDVTVVLPTPRGETPVSISAGASSLAIVVPTGVEYAVSTNGAFHSLSGPTRSAGYDAAKDRVTVTLSTGMSSVTIR